MTRDENQTKIRNENLKKKNFEGQNAEAHQWTEITQGCQPNSVESGGGRWTLILEVVCDTDEELNNLIIWKQY